MRIRAGTRCTERSVNTQLELGCGARDACGEEVGSSMYIPRKYLSMGWSPGGIESPAPIPVGKSLNIYPEYSVNAYLTVIVPQPVGRNGVAEGGWKGDC